MEGECLLSKELQQPLLHKDSGIAALHFLQQPHYADNVATEMIFNDVHPAA